MLNDSLDSEDKVEYELGSSADGRTTALKVKKI
jgi:hypothetical protein